MISYDTHVHSEFSIDSEAPLNAQIEAAINKGLHGLCFTDHTDYGFPVSECPGYDGNPFLFDINEYFDRIKKAAAEHPGIEVMTGIELGLLNDEDVIRRNTDTAEGFSFDQVIGSIHLIDMKDPYFPDIWKSGEASEIIRRYFELTYENICAFSSFDTLGHLDYAARYMPDISKYEPESYLDIVDEILKLIIKKDISLEINTSALKKGLGYTNPHPVFIRRYHELGGMMITTGADAHTPDAIGYGFDTARELLSEAGFDSYFIYKNRKPVELPL